MKRNTIYNKVKSKNKKIYDKIKNNINLVLENSTKEEEIIIEEPKEEITEKEINIDEIIIEDKSGIDVEEIVNSINIDTNVKEKGKKYLIIPSIIFILSISLFISTITFSIFATNTFDEVIMNNFKSSSKLNYSDIEKALDKATISYLEKKKDIKEGYVVYLPISTLIKYRYVSEMTDTLGNACTGYIKYYKENDKIEHSIYIRCGNYVTEGFREDLSF